jgi:hypothetical protein
MAPIPTPENTSFLMHEYGKSLEPLKIKLEKNSKGYNWEISVTGRELEAILAEIRKADQSLRQEYGAV